MLLEVEPERIGSVQRHALAVLLLTSAHHVYGALLYHTPFRLKILPIAALTALVLVAARALSCAHRGTKTGHVATGLFTLTALVVPVLLIGAVEGGYNHALKNVLFFAGLPHTLLRKLFPPPTYVLPNDLVFELTGILQVVPAVTTLSRLLPVRRGRRSHRHA
jgi:hypothetical protein